MKFNKARKNLLSEEKMVGVRDTRILAEGLDYSDTTIKGVAREAIYNADKWLPNDQSEQKEFFMMNDEEKADYIDLYIDDFYEYYTAGLENYDLLQKFSRADLIKEIVNLK